MTPPQTSSPAAAPAARDDAAASATVSAAASTAASATASSPASATASSIATPLDLADIDRLATLARIRLTDSEREPMLEQLKRVFGVLERLRAADTDGVEPMTHPQADALRERPDEVTEPDRRSENQAMAPAVEDGLYLVPKVID